jgi:hypothetical protein
MRAILETIQLWATGLVVALPMLAGSVSAQTSVNDAIRQRRETQSLLELQGARLRARGETIAQKAARAKDEAAAAKMARYRKNHRSTVVAREHPATPKPVVKK